MAVVFGALDIFGALAVLVVFASLAGAALIVPFSAFGAGVAADAGVAGLTSAGGVAFGVDGAAAGVCAKVMLAKVAPTIKAIAFFIVTPI